MVGTGVIDGVTLNALRFPGLDRLAEHNCAGLKPLVTPGTAAYFLQMPAAIRWRAFRRGPNAVISYDAESLTRGLVTAAWIKIETWTGTGVDSTGGSMSLVYFETRCKEGTSRIAEIVVGGSARRSSAVNDTTPFTRDLPESQTEAFHRTLCDSASTKSSAPTGPIGPPVRAGLGAR